MSAAIFIISGLHAIPPIAGAYLTKSKVGLVIGAIIGGVAAIALGGGAYAIFDLVGVAIGCLAGKCIIGGFADVPSPPEVEKETPKRELSSDKILESIPPLPKPAPTVDYSKFNGASSYIVGDRTTVRGEVAAVKSFYNRTLIDIGDKFPREEISLLVWDNHVPALMNKFGNLDLLVGQTITCEGIVSIYKGHLQVKINHPDQLNLEGEPSGMDEVPF